MPNKTEMEVFLSKIFIDNPWVALLIFFLTILAIGLTIYSIIKGTKRKLPKFQIKSNNLIDLLSKYKGFHIQYKKNNVENLTITKISFWNGGGETINKDDIPPLDKIKINTSNGFKILKATIVCETNKVNQFNITQISSNEALLGFEYLDKNDGAIIQIVHTGRSSKDLSLSGTIIGFGSLSKKANNYPSYVGYILSLSELTNKIMDKAVERFLKNKEKDNITYMRRQLRKKMLGIISLLMPMMFAAISFLPKKPTSKTEDIIFLLIFSILYVPLGFYLLKRNAPKNLDLF